MICIPLVCCPVGCIIVMFFISGTNANCLNIRCVKLILLYNNAMNLCFDQMSIDMIQQMHHKLVLFIVERIFRTHKYFKSLNIKVCVKRYSRAFCLCSKTPVDMSSPYLYTQNGLLILFLGLALVFADDSRCEKEHRKCAGLNIFYGMEYGTLLRENQNHEFSELMCDHSVVRSQ